MLLKIFCRYTLIQVLQRAKATFSRKERERDGIFQSRIPPREQQASSERQDWYCRAQLRELAALREVLVLRVLPSLGFPTRHRDPSEEGTAPPQRRQPPPQTAYGSQENGSALNLLTRLHQDNQDPEIPSCSWKVGERNREFNLCETPGFPAPPRYRLRPRRNQLRSGNHQFTSTQHTRGFAYTRDSKQLNTLEVLRR